MKKIAFNEDWQFSTIGESSEKMITIPHDAMISEKRSADSLGGANIGWFEGKDYRYTKRFYVPEDYKDKTVIFEFEGVYHNAEVWINGNKAGFYPYGYTNFYIPADKFLVYGQENKMEVLARNSDQPNSRWYSGAGIYRPVTMWVADEAHILLNGVKIRTLSISPATIEISVSTQGSGNVTAEILDGQDVISVVKAESNGTVRLSVELPGAQLWSPETPKLYTCRVSFGKDQTIEHFGIRTLTWGKDGLCINGQRVILRGACIHHDNGILGASAFPEAEERKIRLLQENGYNAVRSAHNPCSKAMLDACDRLGMLMMDEFVDCWYIHKTENDYVNYFSEYWQQDLTAMVDKDYNHPCVILYSTGNEVSETAQPRGIALTGEMTEFLHRLDETHPVTCGVNIFFNYLSSLGFGVYSDKKAEQEVKRAKKKKKAVGSEFFNNLAGIFGDKTMKLGATLHGCDVKTREAYANMDIAGYNYGILRYCHDLKKYPNRLILGSETFCKDASTFYDLAKDNPRLIGDFVWAGMDYLGEVGIGAWEYQDYAPDFSHGVGWISAGSGRIDLTGKPLAEAGYTRVVFGMEKAPVIAVRPVNHTGDRHSPSAWKMTNAMESWSWHGCEGKQAVVEVYAQGTSVSLICNGKEIGKKHLKECRTQFKLPYADGTLTAVAYDEAGRELSRSTLRTAGKETVLRADPEATVAKPGELCFIRLRYTDHAGIGKPLERHRVHVTVDGGSLIALGNGCPFYPEPYQHNDTDTYYGEALAVIRAGQSSGLKLMASDECRTAQIEIPIESIR